MTASFSSQAANPHRRSASLERLKRRSATARWDELRQTWRFDHSDAGSSADDADQPAVEQKRVDTDHAVDAASPFEQETPALEGNDFAADPVPDLPSLPFIDSSEEADFRFEGTSGPSYVSQAPPGETNGSTLRSSNEVAGVLPKPITAILPYYDYAPNGEDPCEYMCPRPPGCPEGDGSKPCPELVRLPEVQRDRRPFLDTHVAWEPTNLFHNPLYFEDHALERYGHTHCDLLQPFVSVGKFGVQLIGLPYQMALHPPCEQQYTLGWHRPGECVPYRYHFPPWNTKAAITAGAAYTGLIFLIP